MRESEKMRPFEVGDLVVVHFSDNNEIRTIKRIFRKCDNSLTIHLEPKGIVNDSDIKTIRKPRKGSKEARDIVAMIGWDIHNSRLYLKLYFRGKDLKRTFREINAHHNETAIKIVIFEKAKSMLK